MSRPVPREALIVAALLGVGLTAWAIVGVEYRKQAQHLAPRPEATGDVGAVTVYAQSAQGPVPLHHRVRQAFPRPQDLAFTWTAAGTGPRRIKIELEALGQRSLMHAVEVQAPGDEVALEYVLKLGEDWPDDVTVIVTVEPPHSRSVVSEYPLRLVGTEPPGG